MSDFINQRFDFLDVIGQRRRGMQLLPFALENGASPLQKRQATIASEVSGCVCVVADVEKCAHVIL